MRTVGQLLFDDCPRVRFDGRGQFRPTALWQSPPGQHSEDFLHDALVLQRLIGVGSNNDRS
jgi:hypothetical protein